MTRLVLIGSWFLLIGVALVSATNAEINGNAEVDTNTGEDCDPGTTDAPPVDTTTTTEAPKLTCGDNEVYDDCPSDCAADFCPKNEVEAKNTKGCFSRPEKCPAPQCKCAFNHRRAENGTCIPTRDCPAFECSGENEEFNSCPPLCPSDDCSQASASGECPPHFGYILIVLQCAPQCRCRKGYWRKNGVCVPYEECNAPQCGENEMLVKCPADCPSQYCPKSEAEAKQPILCSQPKPCPPAACKCRPNHRRLENGTCVPTRSCPPFECSRPNEEFNPCPPWCPSDDCSQATPDGRCPRRFGVIKLLLICSPKCRCQKGYWRKDGICVPYAECKKEADSVIVPFENEQQCTGPNEEYTLEKQSCPPQECNSLVARIDCRNALPPQPGCACKSGFMRLDSTSSCVPTCQCPQMMHAPQCAGQTGTE